MIKEPEHTPIQKFRLPAEDWARFGQAAGTRNRSALLAQFVRWYLREGPLPKRPAALEEDHVAS
ncbi:hypothetical protein ACQPZX_42710 [Actinoplanes sp. CA-142083]|uniref:hypothetical protein n=1 Tax=Actinoplanes sp. CA-142083 TaxID=3239903 RepID=UPI003D9337DB